jgi:hypothetical protein
LIFRLPIFEAEDATFFNLTAFLCGRDILDALCDVLPDVDATLFFVYVEAYDTPVCAKVPTPLIVYVSARFTFIDVTEGRNVPANKVAPPMAADDRKPIKFRSSSGVV